MPNENTELLDAREFKRKLIARTKNKSDKEGQKIGKYLKNIVPDWQGMRATRLCKYIQDMLKNTENTRRFERELILKRTTQVIPLMTIFFSAFGYLFYITYDIYSAEFFGFGEEFIASAADRINREIDNEIGKGFIVALILITLINASLSSYLFMINVHSQREQEKWKYHIDYLQAVLGINLMRTSIDGEVQNLIIKKTNISFSRLLFLICNGLVLLSFITLIGFSLKTTFASNCEFLWLFFCKPDDLFLLISGIVGLLFSGLTIYFSLLTESFLIGKKRPTIGEVMYIKLLEKIFYHKKEYDEDDNTGK